MANRNFKKTLKIQDHCSYITSRKFELLVIGLAKLIIS